MKRKTSESGMIRYRKIGGGSFNATIGGKRRIIKPNEVFDARPEEIPAAFHDTVVPLDEGVRAAEVKRQAQAASPSPLKYFVKPREKSVGYYDVVDKKGKVQNQKALRKAAAEALIESLMA